MPGPKIVWGIDVGQFALRGIKLRLLDSGAEVLAFDVVEYPQILSQPEVNADQLLAEAAEKFVSRNDLRGSDVVLGVPGQQTFTRFTKLPPVEPKKVNSIVTYEAQQQIPFDMDEVVWDYQVFAVPESPEVEVGIFAIRRDLVRKYLSVFVDKKIEPVLVQASPLGLYNYLAFDDLPQEGAVVILDVGAQNTDLVVARKDGAWTRNIPLGGNNFTEALVKSFKLSFGKAEALKRTAASSRYARQIFQAMRPVFADLVAEIQRSLGYYNSTHRDVPMTKVIGMGNAFKLPGLQKYLQQNLQMEVDKLSTFKKLTFAPGQNPTVFAEYLLSMGVAYGLAVQGLGVGRINNSLLPPEIARTMVWRRKTPWFGAAAGVLLLGGLALGYSRAHVASAVQSCVVPPGFVVNVADVSDAQAAILNPTAPTGRAKAEKVLRAAQKLKNEYMDVVSKASGADQIKQVADLYKNRTLWIELMDRIHATLPQPSPEVATARNSTEYVAALKRIPRHQRRAIYIDQVEAGWVKDTALAYATGNLASSASESRGAGGGEVDRSRGGGGGGGMETAAPVGGGPKGFALILKGRTTYGATLPETVVFLSDWAKKFKDIRGQSVQFYVDKVDAHPQVLPITQIPSNTTNILAGFWAPADVTSQQTTRTSLLAGGGGTFSPGAAGGGYEDRSRTGGGEMDRGRGGGGEQDPSRGRGGGGEGDPRRGAGAGGSSPAYGTSNAASTLVDPLTNEPTNGDYAFQMKLTVVLGAAPEKPADAPTASAAPAR
jgi:type IV pilus assembly protein PilM